jgi:GNAT superfamily N-acetyltransferase
MCDQWMPVIRLPLSVEQFHQLPQNPAYKYEYLDGVAYLSPRPRHYHGLLDLAPREVDPTVPLSPIRPEDFTELETVFAAAFSLVQPFASLDQATRREAARQCLDKTRSGGDGPWIEPASFVALSRDQMVGAVFVTLLPPGDGSDWESYYWREQPPADAITQRLGRPHLTWIFVEPFHAGEGVGTALLAAAVNALLPLGFTELCTTFLVGNEVSALWHWRNGFRLVPYPGSMRRLRSPRPLCPPSA